MIHYTGFTRVIILSSLCALCVLCGEISAQKKKPEKKAEPRIILAQPLGVQPGESTKIILRGLKLDTAKEVRVGEGKISAKIVKKGKAGGLNDKFKAERVGDTEITVELALPKEMAGGTMPVVVVTADGETRPHQLLVTTEMPVVAEKESKGFRDAQEIQLPVAIDGRIESNQDVDVFRFQGTAGEKLVFEVFAARHGSPVDAILLLHDEAGQQIASVEAAALGMDPALQVTLPRAGRYHLTIMDAHDLGGPFCVYRLVARRP